MPAREILEFRELLGTLASRDVKLRYRQTALGAIWVVLQPLIGAGLFSFVFGRVAKLPSDGVPYFLFAFAGLLGWNLFNSILSKSSGSMVSSSHLVSKVYFPRLIVPLSSALGAVVDFLVALGMLVVLLFANGRAPGLGFLALPLLVLMSMTMALGFGVYASSLMVRYRDVQYVVPVFTQFLLYASPIAYAASAVPPKLRGVYAVNPLVGMMEAYRWSLLGTPVASWGAVAYSALFAIGIFTIGIFAFQRTERSFADVI